MISIGVFDHGGWAIFVAAGSQGKLLDRRRVALVDAGLPRIPHHVEAQALPLDQAILLVEKVRASAEHHAAIALDEAAAAIRGKVHSIALRQCPALPPSIAERITNYRSRNVADWVMYRQALAKAAEARGWAIFWYDARRVFDSARGALGVPDLDPHFAALRRQWGPPWTQDHKIAMAAAITALGASGPLTCQGGR